MTLIAQLFFFLLVVSKTFETIYSKLLELIACLYTVILMGFYGALSGLFLLVLIFEAVECNISFIFVVLGLGV